LNRFKFVLGSRGLANTVKRAWQVATRFGVTPGRMEKRLVTLADTVMEYGAAPSLPITATVLDRNPGVARRLALMGVDLPIHGLVHTDMSLLTADVQRAHIEKAAEIFERHGIEARGFRSPYLRYNEATLEAVENLGLSYDSNLAFYWEPSRSLAGLSPEEADGLARGLRFYSPSTRAGDNSLPRFVGRLVEIPVSLPDDEILLDRMGMAPERIGDVWNEMGHMALARGELLTIQLHPERAVILKKSLQKVLNLSRQENSFWVATLAEIDSWWRARTGLKVHFGESPGGGFTLLSPAPSRVELRARIPREGLEEPFPAGAVVDSDRKPLIGVSASVPESLKLTIRDMGYFYDISEDRALYPVYFDALTHRATALDLMRRCGHPLVCDSLWPSPYRAAMAVTGDIDCLTLGDFLRRFRED
jgi:peptidoglycan/xylan/chitin deacetylase (PgdA/CDA1 family)